MKIIDDISAFQECGECGIDKIPVVLIGENPDYESYTAYLCYDCIKKAVALFEKHDKERGEG